MSEEQTKVVALTASRRLPPEKGDRLLAALKAPPRPEAEQPTITASTRSQTRFRSRGRDFNASEFARLAQHGVTADTVLEMLALGFERLTLEQITKLAIHGVAPDYVREMWRLNGGNLGYERLKKLAIHGVDAAYIRDPFAAGLDLAVDDLIKLALYGVDADYIRTLPALELPATEAEDAADLIELAERGLIPAALAALRAVSEGLSWGQVLELAARGAGPEGLGGLLAPEPKLAFGDLTTLVENGVDADYVAAVRAVEPGLSADLSAVAFGRGADPPSLKQQGD